MASTSPSSRREDEPPRIRRDVLLPSIGTILEWYDFSLYIYLAPVLARLFFPSDNALDSLLVAFAVFAVAYLARPVGAIVFGELGDRLGRRKTLALSALLMAIPLILIGALPTEDQIGVAAPILLFVFRVAMGFSVGGEYTGVLTYLLEVAARERRGLVTSLAPIAAGIGALLAVGLTTLIVSVLSREELGSWGWRLPFFVGAAIALFALFARVRMRETPAFERLIARHAVVTHPSAVVLKRARKTVFVAFALSALGSVSYFVGISYVPTYLNSIIDVGHSKALLASTLATALLLGVMALAGRGSDVIGRRPMLIGAAAALALAAAPIFLLLSEGTTLAVYAGTLAFVLPIGVYQAVAAVAIPEQFPTMYRFSGTAIGYNVAVALFGGLAPFLATLLVKVTGDDTMPSLLLIVVALATLVVIVVAVGETARRPLREATPGTDERS